MPGFSVPDASYCILTVEAHLQHFLIHSELFKGCMTFSLTCDSAWCLRTDHVMLLRAMVS
jgi:hypothetical protein